MPAGTARVECSDIAVGRQAGRRAPACCDSHLAAAWAANAQNEGCGCCAVPCQPRAARALGCGALQPVTAPQCGCCCCLYLQCSWHQPICVCVSLNCGLLGCVWAGPCVRGGGCIGWRARQGGSMQAAAPMAAARHARVPRRVASAGTADSAPPGRARMRRILSLWAARVEGTAERFWRRGANRQSNQPSEAAKVLYVRVPQLGRGGDDASARMF